MGSVAENTKHVQLLLEMLVEAGISEAVISPGSRSAPVTIYLAANDHINKTLCIDERSAAYIAMGIAQQKKEPVIFVCTSGTAAVNCYPALIEAFYQQIPVLFLTADRPAEWIDQWDGQTIRQRNLFSNYVNTVEIESSGLNLEHRIQQAIDQLYRKAPRPAHINIPIQEPFYPANLPSWQSAPKLSPSVTSDPVNDELITNLQQVISEAKKPLILAGQMAFSTSLRAAIERCNIPVFADICSNLHNLPRSIENLDFVTQFDKDYNEPDLVISIGTSIISKSCKQHLRRCNFKQVHIGYGEIGDPLSKQPEHIPAAPEEILCRVQALGQHQEWQAQFRYMQEKIHHQLQANIQKLNYCHYTSLIRLFENIDEPLCLHLGNSMPVRWVSLFPHVSSNCRIYCNRGTSGIDGCVSTAVGHAIAAPNEKHLLILGDLSFFYDRNGLWLRELPQNLRVIILNDFGGGIFHIIGGPPRAGKEAYYFQANHKKDASYAAGELSSPYFPVHNFTDLPQLSAGIQGSEFMIGEIFASMPDNEASYHSILKTT